ncbi:hypothetical protein J7337_012562 [Fusarium musae]|uniref:Uncharacterized protein n=1 Tax=Fusarium musae TaxID=1042133 RepID=A0A9P8D670_9HYPO|nr:hypothetical protein J7337_012562 [Fusarium musae]KAG9495991.1 hypothetical protein J7337_012562 [Fusarium musae]
MTGRIHKKPDKALTAHVLATVWQLTVDVLKFNGGDKYMGFGSIEFMYRNTLEGELSRL